MGIVKKNLLKDPNEKFLKVTQKTPTKSELEALTKTYLEYTNECVLPNSKGMGLQISKEERSINLCGLNWRIFPFL